MNRRRTRFARVAVLASALAELLPTSAVAAPDDGFALSDDAALMGGAVIASGRDAASAWYNPALLGNNRRNHIDVSATVYGLRRSRAGAGALELVGDQRRSVEAIDRQFVVVPSAFAIATALRRNVTIGFGAFTSHWYEPDVRINGRGLNREGQYTYFYDARLLGVSRRHHAGPMLGWSPVRGFQIGVSVHGIYDKQERMSRVLANASALEGRESTTLAVNGDSELRSFGGRVILGIRGQLGRWVEAGAVVRTPAVAIHQTFSGSESLVVATIDRLGNPDNRSDLQTDPIPRRPGRLAPWTVGSGLSVGNDRWRVGLDAEAIAALRGPAGDLRQRAIWNVRAGGRVRVARRWTLGAGFFTDRSGVPDVGLAEVDVDLWGGSLGVQFLSPVRLARSEPTRSLAFRTTVAARYAGGVGRFGQLQLFYPDGGPSEFSGAFERTTSATMHFVSLYVGTGLVF